MDKIPTPSHAIELLRNLSGKPGLINLKYAFRKLQALLSYADFQQMRQLATSLSLAPLLARQPRFKYKYLAHYASASFSRQTRVAAIVNHYNFMASVVTDDFFTIVAESPVIWQEYSNDSLFTITLSYPILADFEGELSLNLALDTKVIQMITLLIVPGKLVGATTAQVLLISQVQGTKNASLLKQATKLLHDTTPAMLLVDAAYGLAAALDITHAAGIGTGEQLGRGQHCYFDYDSFWQQFASKKISHNLFLLDITTPEKPIDTVKSKHRSRTLRKRQYKQSVRTTVAQYFKDVFLKR